MSNTQERINKRREYLKKKGGAYTNMALGVLYILLLAWGIYFIYSTCRDTMNTEAGDVSDANSSIIFFLFMASCCLVVIYFLARLLHQSHQKVKQLPYVPPVTIDTLPAEEVLVRGSEAPAQEQSQVLLRGAQSDQESTAKEWLRSS